MRELLGDSLSFLRRRSIWISVITTDASKRRYYKHLLNLQKKRKCFMASVQREMCEMCASLNGVWMCSSGRLSNVSNSQRCTGPTAACVPMQVTWISWLFNLWSLVKPETFVLMGFNLFLIVFTHSSGEMRGSIPCRRYAFLILYLEFILHVSFTTTLNSI